MNSLPHETLAFPGGPAPIEWRRSRAARRVTLRIDPSRGHVIVTLPIRAPRAAGLALLTKHADWVAEQRAKFPAPEVFTIGAALTIDGVPHRIQHTPGAQGGVRLEGAILYISGDPTEIPRQVTDFLRREAQHRLARQASAKAAKAGLVFTRVTVKDPRTRWGSCSAKGVLMFSWRLLMAPSYVQDYVVAHEVAHLKHLDHGADFWALANLLSPHRTSAISWLEREGPRLLRVG